MAKNQPSKLSFHGLSVLTLMIPTAICSAKLPIPTPGPDQLFQLETQVHSYYVDEWTKLLFFIGALITLVGLVIPIVSLYMQNSAYKMKNKEMKELIAAAKKEAKDDMKSETEVIKRSIASLEQRSEDRLNTFVNSKMTETNSSLKQIEAGVFAVQGNMAASNGDLRLTVYSYLTALEKLCLATPLADMGNFSTVLGNLEHSFNMPGLVVVTNNTAGNIVGAYERVMQYIQSTPYIEFVPRLEAMRIPITTIPQ
jgi:hypothetical protein